MLALNLIVFISLITCSCGGLISRDRHRLYGENNQNSTIVYIKSHQQQLSETNLSHHVQDGPRGDYGDDGDRASESTIQATFKTAQGGMNRGGSNMNSTNYNDQQEMSDSSSDFPGTTQIDTRTSKMMNQENVKHDAGHKFDHPNGKTKYVCQCLRGK